MKTAPTKLYHLEGAVRPCSVRWLANKSIVVCRTSGTLELQPDYNSSLSHPYRSGLGILKLQPIPNSNSIFVLGDAKCEIVNNGERGLTINTSVLPAGLDSTTVCIIPRFGLYLLATREGALWLSLDGFSWNSAGRLTIHDVTVGCAFSEDQYIFGSAHGEIELVTLFPFTAKGRQRLHADAVQDIFTLDVATIGTVSRDRALRVWRVSDKFELLWSIPDLHAHFVNCAVRVRDEIWTGSSDGTIAITSLKTRSKISSFKGHSDAIRILDLSQDGMRLLSLSDDATYNIYDTQSMAILKRYGEERQYIRSGDFSFQGRSTRSAFGSTSGFLHYGELEADLFSKARISTSSLRALRHLNETQIICGDETGVVQLFNCSTGKALGLGRTGVGLTTIRINPHNKTILCGYRDGHIRVYSSPNIETLSEQKLLPLSLNADSKNDTVLEPLSGESFHAPIHSHRIHESIVGDMFSLPNGLMLSCSDDHTIKTIILDSFSILKTTSLDGTAINNLLVISNLLVATTDGGTVFVLDAITHEIFGKYTCHINPVRAISKISDSLIATGDRLGEVRIWDVKTCNTISVNQFRERIIELGYDAENLRLCVITESEVASLQLDNAWFLATEKQNVLVGRQDKIDPLHLDDVEIAKTGKSFQPSSAEDRLIRKFTKWRGGTRCELGLLSGGLSDARVFRVKIFDHSGATRINAVAKIGSRAAISAEARQYDNEVSRLSPDATPRRLESHDFSDENTAGVFYSLAESYDRSEFQVVAEMPTLTKGIIDRVAYLTAPWRDRVPETRTMIGDARRRIMDDKILKNIAATYSLDWVEDFERRTVQVKLCTIHGDLHGGNILVDRSGAPIIIDYGNVTVGLTPFDPITLEFSHLLHPDGPLCKSEWPKTTQAKMWKTEEYLLNCPMPDISRACWRWAEAVCAGHREIAAAAYVYLVSQLKYRDTNKERILSLLDGVRTFYNST